MFRNRKLRTFRNEIRGAPVVKTLPQCCLESSQESKYPHHFTNIHLVVQLLFFGLTYPTMSKNLVTDLEEAAFPDTSLFINRFLHFSNIVKRQLMLVSGIAFGFSFGERGTRENPEVALGLLQ